MSSKPEISTASPRIGTQKSCFFELLIQLYAEIPSFLGGSVDFAEKKANELRNIYILSREE